MTGSVGPPTRRAKTLPEFSEFFLFRHADWRSIASAHGEADIFPNQGRGDGSHSGVNLDHWRRADLGKH
jgi:hypothetical protein